MRDERTSYSRSALGPISRLLAAGGLLSCMLLGSLGAAHAAPIGLHVVDTTPSAGASGIGATGFVSITFDRPVVSLNDVGAPGVHTPVVVTPTLPGKGRWINTSVWGYQAAAGLPLATRYQVTTRPDLRAQDGSVLGGTYSFSFTTLRPGVVSVSPPGATRNALPNAAVQVVFNQPVQHTSAQHAFSLTADGVRLPGRFSWNDKLIATQPNGVGSVPQAQEGGGGGGNAPVQPAADTVMTFHPATRAPLGASVVASIAPGVLGKQGPLGMATPYSWRYSLAGPLRITGTAPIAGSDNANLSNGLVLTLTAPVTQAQAAKAIHVRPALSSQYVYVDDNGTTVTISGDFQPSTAYTVTVDTRAIGTASQALAGPYSLHFTTQATIPSVQLISQGPAAVYNDYLGTNIYARVVNLAAITVRVNRLSAGQFLGLMYSPPQNWNGTPPAGSPQLTSYTVSSAAPRNRSILVKQPLQGIGPGYYLVNAGPGAGGGSAGDHLLMLVTRTSVTLKIGQRQAFVWATDLRSGKPVAGESVRIVDNKGRVWSSGSTGADGVFKAGVHGVGASDSLLQHTLQAQLTHGVDVAAAGLDWNSGVSSYDFNLPFNSYQQPVRIYLTTERPIYRPGQPVYFKGIARADNDGRYSLLPAGTRVRVQVQDARQASIYDQRLTLDQYGAFNGKLILSIGASVGGYTISASAGVSGGNSAFQVAEYKKPTYAVSAISDRGANANYQQGQNVGVQVRARYYFGRATGQGASHMEPDAERLLLHLLAVPRL